MNNFGVISKKLKLLAKKVPFPKLISYVENNETRTILGLNVKNVTLGERSATGMFAEKGVFIVDVNKDSRFNGILKPRDIFLSYNQKDVNNMRDFQDAVIAPNWTDSLKIVVFRGGNSSTITLKK